MIIKLKWWADGVYDPKNVNLSCAWDAAAMIADALCESHEADVAAEQRVDRHRSRNWRLLHHFSTCHGTVVVS